MIIRELIAHLLQSNNLDDEIIVAYWDKKYFVDELDLHSELDPLWKEFIKVGQETVNGHLGFTQTGYELVADLEKMIEENE